MAKAYFVRFDDNILFRILVTKHSNPSKHEIVDNIIIPLLFCTVLFGGSITKQIHSTSNEEARECTRADFRTENRKFQGGEIDFDPRGRGGRCPYSLPLHNIIYSNKNEV